MSVYQRRYEVHTDWVSHYTSDPAEALRMMDQAVKRGTDPSKVWCNEGYADEDFIDSGHRLYQGIEGTLYTRRTLGQVSRGRLLLAAYRRERAKVQQMIEDLRSGRMVAKP